LIRSRRRRALLCVAGSSATTRLGSSVGSLWTRRHPSAKVWRRLRSMNDPEGPDIKSRSVLDLERLSSSPMSRRTSGRPIPHLGKARRRLVYCSLDDVKCRDPEIGQRSRGVNPRAWQSGPIAAL
jgi:hypothetical protein